MDFVQIKNLRRFRFGSLFLILSFFVSAFRAISPADYSVLTSATAYPTLTPIGATATIIPPLATVNFSCPVGIPVGAGTVTPSLDWLMGCGQCLATGTSAVLPTSTSYVVPTAWIITGTPPANCTPQPANLGDPNAYICFVDPAPTGTSVSSGTSTPVPTATINYSVHTVGCLINHGSECVENNNHKVTLTYTQNGFANTRQEVNFNYFNYYASQLTYVRVSGLNPTQFFNLYEQKNTVFALNNTVRTGQNTNSWSQLTTLTNSYTGLSGEYRIQTYSGSNTFEGSFTSGSVADYWNYNSSSIQLKFSAPMSGYGQGLYKVGTYTVEVSTDPFTLPTATPAPTAVPTATATPNPNYCGTVSGTNIPNQFNLGGTGGVVFQSCLSTPLISPTAILEAIIPSVFWGDFLSGALTGLFGTSFEIDPITFCVRQRDYSLYILGFRMPIELILGLGVFLSSLRFFVPTVFSGASVIGQNTPTVSSTTSTTVTRNSTGTHRSSSTTKSTRKRG